MSGYDEKIMIFYKKDFPSSNQSSHHQLKNSNFTIIFNKGSFEIPLASWWRLRETWVKFLLMKWNHFREWEWEFKKKKNTSSHFVDFWRLITRSIHKEIHLFLFHDLALYNSAQSDYKYTSSFTKQWKLLFVYYHHHKIEAKIFEIEWIFVYTSTKLISFKNN